MTKLSFALGLVLMACGSGFDFGTTVKEQVRTIYDLSVAPSPAHVADSVIVTFKTAGDGCVAPAEPDIRISGLTVQITPYQTRYIAGPPEGCTRILRYDAHRLAFKFEAPGLTRFLFIGPGVEQTVTVS